MNAYLSTELMPWLLGSVAVWWALFGLAGLALIYLAANRWAWTGAGLLMLGLFAYFAQVSVQLKLATAVALLMPLAVFILGPIRRRLFSEPLFRLFRDSVPLLSDAQWQGINAGEGWWEQELFSGRPRWRRLLQHKACRLSDEERAFLDGSVETLCERLDEPRWNHTGEIPPQIWDALGAKGFFALVVPSEHGGRGFSTAAINMVIAKLASRSVNVALCVAMANGVAPARLLVSHGSESQRKRYLSRLLSHDLVPAFALTTQHAGSDATAQIDVGTVQRGADGALMVNLSVAKRYVLMAPTASLVLVAFVLDDPQGLLGMPGNVAQPDENLDDAIADDITDAIVDDRGEGSDEPEPGDGLTLALIETSGQAITRQHHHIRALPIGTLSGADIQVPLENLLGGTQYIGRGWQVLCESFADARALGVPAVSAASCKLAVRLSGAYARVRYQFGTYLGQFGAVQGVLAQLAGNTFAVDAARVVTLGAIDAGHRPALASMLSRQLAVSRARQSLPLAGDVMGAAALCAGPHNLLHEYRDVPALLANWEGSPLMDASIGVYGQCLVRLHPVLREELQAIGDADLRQGAARFDRAITRHMALMLRHGLRTVLLGLTGGHLVPAPMPAQRGLRQYYRQVSRMSAAFALSGDLLVLGTRGNLRLWQQTCTRMTDIAVELYAASSALKYYIDQGWHDTDRPIAQWVLQDSLHRIGVSFERLCENLPVPFAGRVLRRMIFPWGRAFAAPSDALSQRVAQSVLVPSSARDRLTAGMYLQSEPQADDPLGRLERALRLVMQAKPTMRKLRDGARVQLVRGDTVLAQLQSAVAAGVVSDDEAQVLSAAERARDHALKVECF